MERFAQVCEAVAATTKKTEKVRLVGEYLRGLAADDARFAALFFTGRPFPRIEERVLGVGGSLIWQALGRLASPQAERFEAVYRKHGDLGAMAEEVLQGHLPSGRLSLADVRAAFDQLAGLRGGAAKLARLEDLLRRASPLEAKYIIKIVTGDLRIGLKESLVEEAIARAYARPLPDVQRANMLTGDIGTTLLLAASDRLSQARFQLSSPIGFMLASPAETAEEAIEYFPDGALVEDKYDGIRAQAHKSGEKVKLFSRTLDEITEFPELLGPLRALEGDFILDGEIIGWRDGRPVPFTDFQKRLGRKPSSFLQPSLFPDHGPESELAAAIPALYVVFDLLYAEGSLRLDTPLAERRRRLESLLGTASNTSLDSPPELVSAACTADHLKSAGNLKTAGNLKLAPANLGRTPGELEQFFQAALERGHEGIVAKAPDSPYTPGRRGRQWMKLKRPLATLDVVVTAVEYGHGKRHGLLSDYTFSVRASDDGDDGRLLPIGKAYSGLTDAEIGRLTEYFKEHTIEDHGFSREVEPTVVIEVAFNNIQRSNRHESGYALRFPRIVRLRPDKAVSEIDTLERVAELYRRGLGPAGPR